METYLKDGDVVIRSMMPADIVLLFEAFEKQNSHKPKALFEKYFNDQSEGIRLVVIAETDDKIAGYATLLPRAVNGPYASLNIPEIVDFNVLNKYQRHGIGNRIMDTAEGVARQTCDSVSLSVGLHSGYGSAQRMYVKRGYIPDGSGVWFNGSPLEQYAPCMNDDELVLYMKKDFPRINRP